MPPKLEARKGEMMKLLNMILLFALIALLFAACAPSESIPLLSRFDLVFINDFAKRSDVSTIDCQKDVISRLTSDGTSVIFGTTSDGFQDFGIKNERAAKALGASESNNWQLTKNNQFLRSYFWESEDEVDVYYLPISSGGGQVTINY
jgi:ABC-type oligopeptide transport system substrate-binding subunit